MTLGQRIQEHRLRLELSQEALGERLGVSRQAVSKWEADAAVPDTDKLIALSKLFGLTLNELLQVEGPEGTSTSGQEMGCGPNESRGSAGAGRSPRKNGARWLLGALTAMCLVLAVGLVWTEVRLTALEERVVQQMVMQDTLDPADLVGDWELSLPDSDVRMYSPEVGYTQNVGVTVALSRREQNRDWEIFFQVYGSDTAARRVEAQADAGAGGVYSAQVPVVLGGGETIAVGFCIDGVEYLQPLVRITGLTDHSMHYEELLQQI